MLDPTDLFNTLPEDTTIGVVGAGNITQTKHLPILSEMNDVEIEYVADIDDEKLNDIKSYYEINAEKLNPNDGGVNLSNVDVMLLAIPVGARKKYVEYAKNNNIALLIEKPFAASTIEHKYILKNIDCVSCNYMRTYYESIRTIKGLIRKNIFGPVRSISIKEEGKIGATGLPSNHYQNNKSMAGGGILTERGCHTLSQLNIIFPKANISVENSSIVWNGDFDVHVDTELRIENNENEFMCDFKLSSIKKIGDEMVVKFDNCALIFDQKNPGSKVRIKSNKDFSEHEITTDTWAENNVRAMYLNWREFLLRESDLKYTDEGIGSSLKTTKTIFKIYEEA